MDDGRRTTTTTTDDDDIRRRRRTTTTNKNDDTTTTTTITTAAQVAPNGAPIVKHDYGGHVKSELSLVALMGNFGPEPCEFTGGFFRWAISAQNLVNLRVDFFAGPLLKLFRF